MGELVLNERPGMAKKESEIVLHSERIREVTSCWMER